MIEADFCVFDHLLFHPGLFMQNIGFDAGHRCRSLVKKSEACFYNFWFAPENWLLRDLSTREGRFISKEDCSGGFLEGIK